MAEADLQELRELVGRAKRPNRSDTAVLDEVLEMIEAIAATAGACREALATQGKIEPAETAAAAAARTLRRDTYGRLVALIEAAAIEAANCR